MWVLALCEIATLACHLPIISRKMQQFSDCIAAHARCVRTASLGLAGGASEFTFKAWGLHPYALTHGQRA